jgi:lycopene cyclase domain-containing protein
MPSYLYLLCLLGGLGGLAFLDYRLKLLLFARDTPQAPRWVAGSIILSVLFFLLWDIVGIMLAIFWTNPAAVIGISLGSPNLPLEELCFLTLLSYLSLLMSRLWHWDT